MGAGRLASNLKISFDAAVELLDTFWKKFPKIKRFLDKVVADGEKNGYALSILDKRRRWLIDFNLLIPRQKAHFANICKNNNFQSTNASIIKRALCYIQDGFFAHPEWEAKLLITIHDECLTTQLVTYEKEVLKFVEDEMIRAGEHYIKKIPVVVDAQLGKCWLH